MKSTNKYRNKKTVIDGITFDSIKEANRYMVIKEMFKQGEITDVILQPKFPIVDSVRCPVKNRKLPIRYYIADFAYTCTMTGDRYVEDVKGMLTPMYRLKKQIFLLKYGAKYKFIET